MRRPLLLCLVTAACSSNAEPAMHDAAPAIDAAPTPLAYCSAGQVDTLNCSMPLPVLLGTWMDTADTTRRITFADSTKEGAPCLDATVSGTWPSPVPSGGWYPQATEATHQAGTTVRISTVTLCVNNGNPAQLRLSAATRVPGFHTAWETIEYYSALLAAAPP